MSGTLPPAGTKKILSKSKSWGTAVPAADGDYIKENQISEYCRCIEIIRNPAKLMICFKFVSNLTECQ